MTTTLPDRWVMQGALRLACRAPSIHNSQPWFWVIRARSALLFVDRHRLIRVADSSGRQAIISCGAILDHFRTAMAAAGWDATVERMPDTGNVDHLATITFDPSTTVTDEQRHLADAILMRRTDRLPLRRPFHWPMLMGTLRNAVGDDVVRLDELTDDMRPRLAAASQISRALRECDASYHSELQCWTAPFALYQGIPPENLATFPEAAHVGLERDFPVVGNVDRRRGVEIDGSRLLVVSTADDSRIAVLRSGEALSRVLLECTVAGMATCTLTHLIEVVESREILRGLISGRGEPQALIRVGVAPSVEVVPAATPRLPLNDIMKVG